VSVARAITLPHGVFAKGRLVRDAELRAPTGWDEVYLAEEAGELTGLERTTAVLERCVTRVGAERATVPALRSLTAGDREAILLHLRAAAFGDRLSCVVDCPECSSRMDVELSVAELLVPPYADPQERYATTFIADGRRCDVSFRLPTGADLESATGAANVEDAARRLLERCIETVTLDGEPSDGLPVDASGEVSAAMARLDPQAELQLVMTCPECEQAFSAALDAATLLLEELTPTSDRLYQEVHALALHYHWSEREILGLDVPRRRRYLELLADDPAQPEGALG
jgi:hypothetical protein